MMLQLHGPTVLFSKAYMSTHTVRLPDDTLTTDKFMSCPLPDLSAYPFHSPNSSEGNGKLVYQLRRIIYH